MPEKSSNYYDVIIIGAGHNGLTCAGYLAKAGLSVLVVERRGVVGGAAVTEEFAPGFRNSACSYLVSLLSQEIIQDLSLYQHGLSITRCSNSLLAPNLNNRHLMLYDDCAQTSAELLQFSRRDARAYPEFEHRIDDAAAFLRQLMHQVPPNVSGGLSDIIKLGKIGKQFSKLDKKSQHVLLKLLSSSLGDFLDDWFELDNIKGAMGYLGIVGNMVSPYAAGSAYVLLHHAIGQSEGVDGAWGHAQGGMGAITQAMASFAQSKNVDILVNASVDQVIVENGRASGILLEDGRVFRGRSLAANVNPKLLFLNMIDSTELDSEFLHQMKSWRCRSGSFRMNVALSELPKYDNLKHESDAISLISGTTQISPSLDYLEQAYDDAKVGHWSKAPVIEICIPSLLDDSLAPDGQHVMSLFCQHFNPLLKDDISWDDVKESVADLVIDTVNQYAPNFKQSIIARQVLSPLDLEREYGLLGGDIFHGALHLDQLYSLRPAAGFAGYKMPIKDLYLCGSGAHPGGGVSGIPGQMAAKVIIRDLKSWNQFRKW